MGQYGSTYVHIVPTVVRANSTSYPLVSHLLDMWDQVGSGQEVVDPLGSFFVCVELYLGVKMTIEVS